MIAIDVSQIIVIETLDENYLEDFISEFGEIEFFTEYEHPNTPKGQGIRLNYENGDFLVVIGTFYDGVIRYEASMYDENGNFIEFYGRSSRPQNFVDLVNQYFIERFPLYH